MRRIFRPGTVLLVAAVVLLGLAAAHRVTAPSSPRVMADRAAFARYVASRPGRFGPVRVTRHKADLVCAVHVHPRYRLCGSVHRRPDGVGVFRPRRTERRA
jgi:hypothetical protein